MLRARITWLATSILSSQLVLCGVACAQLQTESATSNATNDSKQAALIDPTGTWKWDSAFGDNTSEFKLKLNWDGKKLAGKYTAFDNTSDIEEGKLEKDKVSFLVKREFNGQEFIVNFEGQVKPDEINGAIKLEFDNEPREFDWNAKRTVEIDDVVGVWDLRVETENGVVEPKLTITKDGEKLRGKSVSEVFGELEAKNLSLKDNELSWEVTGTNGGVEISVKYKGKPRGNTIEGENEFTAGGGTGTMKFTGKRTPPEEKEKPSDGGSDATAKPNTSSAKSENQ